MNKEEKETIERFKEVYKEIKRIGFRNYFICSNNGIPVSWKDINDIIENRIKLPKEALKSLKGALDKRDKWTRNGEKIVENIRKQNKSSADLSLSDEIDTTKSGRVSTCKCGHKKKYHNYDFTTECSKCSGGQCSKFEPQTNRGAE